MKGVIRYGNYSNIHEITAENPLRVVELTGDIEIVGGNWKFARVNDNGFNIVDSANRLKDWYLNGVDQGCTPYEVKVPFDKAVQILAALEQGGEDAEEAYEAIVDLLQADTAPLMDLQEFISAYAALATDNLTYSANLLKKLAVAVQGQEWMDGKTNAEIFAAAQSFIRGKTKEHLMGEDTELVRVVT